MNRSGFSVLDLYCCEGGAAEGYRQAGASLIVGVDNKPQRNYRFGFIRADVLDLDLRFIRQFDYVHASPGCQFVTDLNNDKSRHANLIPPTRRLLQAAGVRYTIENVRKARPHLIDPVSLLGFMFGNRMTTSDGTTFHLSRERLFETNWGLQAPTLWSPQRPIANVFGGHLRARGGDYRTGKGTGRTVDFPGEDRPALARELMGMPWASVKGISEAVPPSFTKYIGEQFMAQRLREAA